MSFFKSPNRNGQGPTHRKWLRNPRTCLRRTPRSDRGARSWDRHKVAGPEGHSDWRNSSSLQKPRGGGRDGWGGAGGGEGGVLDPDWSFDTQFDTPRIRPDSENGSLEMRSYILILREKNLQQLQVVPDTRLFGFAGERSRARSVRMGGGAKLRCTAGEGHGLRFLEAPPRGGSGSAHPGPWFGESGRGLTGRWVLTPSRIGKSVRTSRGRWVGGRWARGEARGATQACGIEGAGGRASTPSRLHLFCVFDVLHSKRWKSLQQIEAYRPKLRKKREAAGEPSPGPQTALFRTDVLGRPLQHTGPGGQDSAFPSSRCFPFSHLPLPARPGPGSHSEWKRLPGQPPPANSVPMKTWRRWAPEGLHCHLLDERLPAPRFPGLSLGLHGALTAENLGAPKHGRCTCLAPGPLLPPPQKDTGSSSLWLLSASRGRAGGGGRGCRASLGVPPTFRLTSPQSRPKATPSLPLGRRQDQGPGESLNWEPVGGNRCRAVVLRLRKGSIPRPHTEQTWPCGLHPRVGPAAWRGPGPPWGPAARPDGRDSQGWTGWMVGARSPLRATTVNTRDRRDTGLRQSHREGSPQAPPPPHAL